MAKEKVYLTVQRRENAKFILCVVNSEGHRLNSCSLMEIDMKNGTYRTYGGVNKNILPNHRLVNLYTRRGVGEEPTDTELEEIEMEEETEEEIPEEENMELYTRYLDRLITIPRDTEAESGTR